jgi:hypothetical protein
MDPSLFTSKDIVRYLIVIGLIYTILKVIPSQQMANKDVILLLGIIIFGFVSIDCIFFKNSRENFAENPNPINPNPINLVPAQPLIQTPKTTCSLELESIQRKFEQEISQLKNQLNMNDGNKIATKYFEALLVELNDNGILDANEIENIKIKTQSKLLSMDEVIASLENLKKHGKSKNRTVDGKSTNDNVYNELPSDFYRPIGDKIANEWGNEYSILNTDKWQVPMPRPPVCISTTAPCPVCPSESSSSSINLKEWDNARYVSQTTVNKKWANDQANAQK